MAKKENRSAVKRLLCENDVSHRYSNHGRSSYETEGYDIVMLSSHDILDRISQHIVEEDFFSREPPFTNTSFKCGVGSGKDEFNIGRKIINSDEFGKETITYKLLSQLKDEAIAAIFDVKGFEIKNSADNFSFSFLKSIAKDLDEPQHLHFDTDYNHQYATDNILMLVALEDDTQFCLQAKTHKYENLEELRNDRSVNFQNAQVFHLRKGEVLFMNVKLLHCGWLTEIDNTRVHFNINPPKNFTAEACIPYDVAITKFTGDAKEQQIKNLRFNCKNKRISNFGSSKKSKIN